MWPRALGLIVRRPVAYTRVLTALSWTVTLAAIKYILNGPPAPSWTLKTYIIRDIVRLYVGGGPEFGSLFSDLNSVGSFGSGQQVAKLDGGIAAQFDIPAVSLREQHLENSGIWRGKLMEVAKISADTQIGGEVVIADNAVPHGADITNYVPSGKVLLHFHGGAFTAGTLDTYRNLHLLLSKTTGLPVYGFAYRLAPAFQYPTQLYDALCAFEHLKSIGVREQDIVFSGDSAGGNLALGLWQLLRPAIRGMILLSPRVDVTSERNSWTRNAEADILPLYDINRTSSSVRMLLGPNRPVDTEMLSWLSDPFIAPVHADFSGLPPTLLQAGTAEMMYDDIALFADRAMKVTDKLLFQTYPDEIHVFQGVPGMPHARQALDAVRGFSGSL